MIFPLFLLKRSFCPPSKPLWLFYTPKSMARKACLVIVQIIPARRCFGIGTLRVQKLLSFSCTSTAPAESNLERTSMSLSSRAPCPTVRRWWPTACASWDYRKMMPASIPACLKLSIWLLLDITLSLEVWAVVSFYGFFLVRTRVSRFNGVVDGSWMKIGWRKSRRPKQWNWDTKCWFTESS